MPLGQGQFQAGSLVRAGAAQRHALPHQRPGDHQVHLALGAAEVAEKALASAVGHGFIDDEPACGQLNPDLVQAALRVIRFRPGGLAGRSFHVPASSAGSPREALADAGLLRVHGWFKGWPPYSCRDLDVIDADQLAAITAERQAWTAASVHASQAPGYLGWQRGEFEQARRRRGLQAGRYDRYARAGLDALAGDEDCAPRHALSRAAGRRSLLEVAPARSGPPDRLR